MTATARDVIVSDHAVLRWLERVEGFDVEALRKRLGEAARIGLRHGAAGVLLGAGRLVLRDCVVVTTLRREHVRVDLIGAAQIEIDLLVDAPPAQAQEAAVSDFSRLDPEVGDFLDSLQPLAAEIGVATTLEIVRLFGGARLYVPRRWTPDLEFNALGEAVAGRLCAMFGPERIDIPRMPFTVAALRRYAERLRAQEGLTNGQIARALGLSWRSVTRLGGTASFAAGRRRRRIDERQIDLEELLGTPPSAS